MFDRYCILLLTFGLLQYSQSLQSGYTCETSVTLACPAERKILILEVTYSSECPTANEEKAGGNIYAPTRCVGYDRQHTSTLCNGKETCTIDNNPGHRPSFVVGKQANCEFVGQSINVDYSCIPDLYSSKLPRVDICSLQSLHGLTEGFIHTPNYPNGYPTSLTCSKTVPSPDVGHRLKIYVLDFDVEGFSVLRFLGIKRINDWFKINNSGEKMCGQISPYTLLFDDIIEASLMFKSDFANTKRSYKGFVLYFVVTPIRASRPLTTTTEKILDTNPAMVAMVSNKNNESSSVLMKSKSSALISNDQHRNNTRLTLLVVVLSGILFVGFCGFILYKRRNDRRIRYLTDTFNSFFPIRSKNTTLNTSDNNDEVTLNNTMQSKLDLSSVNNDEKYTKINNFDDKSPKNPPLKHININEKRENQEKQVFIENLKACSSPYSSYRRSENKFNAKEPVVNIETNKNSNIYSEDPLVKTNSSQNIDNDSLLYEFIDLNQEKQEKPQQQRVIEESKQEQEQQETLYDVINPNNERPVQQETDYDSVMYAIPKDA